MTTWKEFTLDTVQAVAFITDPASFSGGRAVALILQKFGDRFDGEMQALPLPASIPPEIPRIVLQSKGGSWQLNMGPARIDVIWSNKSLADVPNLEAVVRQCAEVLEHYVRGAAVKVGRLALIVNRGCRIHNPAQALIDQFCNDASKQGPFRRSASFEIHNHKAYKAKGERDEWEINSWVRCKTADGKDGPPVLTVTHDLNTLATEMETRRFDAEQLSDFFQTAGREADEIVGRYFPC